MESMMKKELKQVSIGQAIVNAVKPRSCIAPLLFGLGIEVDKVFSSKWLLTELNRLGFSISHDETTRYKQSAVCNEDVSDFIKANLSGSFSQWSADNVDHNVCTMDGKGTLHGMGLIVSTTPGSSLPNLTPILRQKMEHAGEVTVGKGIPILYFDPPDESGLSSVILKPLNELKVENVLPKYILYDYLWHISYFFSNPRPSWSGYRSNISIGEHPGKSTISLLPIIDLNPIDMTCIYSTLKFVQSQAKELNKVTPVITFDQPLYIKAMEIVKAKNMNMVVMLGGFHLLMSFLGRIGEVMKGSGLEDALEELYGKSTVPHLVSGKSVSRTLRGHFLVESALVCQLLVSLISMENDLEEDDMENETCNNTTSGTTVVKIDDMLIEIENMTDAIKEDKVVKMHEDSSLLKLRISLEEYKKLLGDSSRTAKLSLQYLYYIDIVRLFIRAERVGDWDLYLISVKKMINMFPATGHINYAKCARLHLHDMLDLKNTHPWIYERFRGGGLHKIRRSDKYWAGILADLTIEQVMMRAIKTNSSLTRRRGVSEKNTSIMAWKYTQMCRYTQCNDRIDGCEL